MLFLVQEWLDTQYATHIVTFLEHVCVECLLMNWLQFQFTPCEASPNSWISFTWQSSQYYGYPTCLCTISYRASLFLTPFYVHALLQQTTVPFNNDFLLLTLHKDSVNECHLNICQVSNRTHNCGYVLNQADTLNLYCRNYDSPKT